MTFENKRGGLRCYAVRHDSSSEITDYQQIQTLSKYLFKELFKEEAPNNPVIVCSKEEFRETYEKECDTLCPVGLEEVFLYDDEKPPEESEILLTYNTAGAIIYQLFHAWGHVIACGENIDNEYVHETVAGFHGISLKTRIVDTPLPQDIKLLLIQGMKNVGNFGLAELEANDELHQFEMIFNNFLKDYDLLNLETREKILNCKSKDDLMSVGQALLKNAT
jgi:hypothetical protein